MEPVQILRPIRSSSLLSVSNRFHGFDPHIEIPMRKDSQEPDKAHDLIMLAWEETMTRRRRTLQDLGGVFKGMSIRSSDVLAFSVALADYQDAPDFKNLSGMFINALIALSPDKSFVVRTSHLSVLPVSLGMGNTRDIIVQGPAGSYAGLRMSDGSMVIEGDAGYRAGEGMIGGSLSILGDADIEVGHGMDRGRIRVYGIAYDSIGNWMNGGDIVLGPVHGWLSANIRHCRIFEDDRLILER